MSGWVSNIFGKTVTVPFYVQKQVFVCVCLCVCVCVCVSLTNRDHGGLRNPLYIDMNKIFSQLNKQDIYRIAIVTNKDIKLSYVQSCTFILYIP